MKQFINSLGKNPQMAVQFLDSIRDLTFLMEKEDSSFRYIYINKAARELLGVKDTIGKKIEEITDGEHVFELKEKYEEVYRTRQTVTFEQQLRTVNGDVYIGESSLNPVTEEDGSVHYIVGIVRDITELRREQKVLSEMAFKDHLTGLANRRSFDDKLDEALAFSRKDSKKVGVMMLDGKKFKQINDTFGHDAGDKVIKEFAKRIEASVRKTDTVARLGGDEMGIVLPGLETIEEAKIVADRIVKNLDKPFYYKGERLDFGAGIGISFFPDQALSKYQVLRNADDALYVAKELDGSGYVIYEG